MRKLWTLLLPVVFAFALLGCSDDDTTDPTTLTSAEQFAAVHDALIDYINGDAPASKYAFLFSALMPPVGQNATSGNTACIAARWDGPPLEAGNNFTISLPFSTAASTSEGVNAPSSAASSASSQFR